MLVNTDDNSYALNSSFPTYAQILKTVNPNYNDRVWWFGKWHLSDARGPLTDPLVNYGFRTRTYPQGVNPSPDGWANEGTNGGVFDSPGDVLDGVDFASDPEITGDFSVWLTSNGANGPWCATVSLVNPHDISWFPDWFFPDTYPTRAAASTADAHYTFPSGDYQAFPDSLPSVWNSEDVANPALNKPPLQAVFRQQIALANGTVGNADPRSWLGLMQYYYSLQSQVDSSVGTVLSALSAQPAAVTSKTVVIFTADHGDHCGSHSLRTKGASAYDETMRVPLYIRYPGQTIQRVRYQMCGAVDFPRLIAELGNNGVVNWSTSAFPYLDLRESIYSFVQLATQAEQKRLVTLNGVATPYILHTYDNFKPNSNRGATVTWASISPTLQSHIVCLRTKTDLNPNSPNYNGGYNGAKFALYYYWANCAWYPANGQTPFVEYYDYGRTLRNRKELGNNDYNNTDSDSLALRDAMQAALGAFSPLSGLIGTELLASLPSSLQQAQLQARQAYLTYVSGGTC